ncbi:deacylase [Sphingobacterium psychroaquaticum]|uniref:acyloxyacyl hydrolase n=1 Tax=Sphingobacterium psychroaquaticum TaxID=561061 RepID=UPI00106990E2|nr:acyloxyacyl hydrolase [Sphingobacterium psychroaquaticum]QBQ41052.1 deacylase [Sphingobacterium psychroaquaticum]
MEYYIFTSKKLLFSICTTFIFLQQATAQVDSTIRNTPVRNPLIIEIEVENGGILASKEVKNTTFQSAYYNGVNLKVGWKIQKSDDQYFKLYNNPIYGIGFYSSTFNTEILGSPYAIYGFVQTPFGNLHNKKWEFDYRIGLGISGNFRPYDEETNPLNLVIGAKNNVYIDLGIRAQYKLTPEWRTGVGLAFHHFSNGALKLPNKGVNLFPLTASLTYQPGGGSVLPDKHDIKAYTDKLYIHLNYGVGWKQIERDRDRRFFKSTFSTYVSKHVSHKWRMGGGFDVFYSASGNNDDIAGDEKGKLSAKLSGGPSFYLVHVLNNDLVLNGNVGYYVHKQEFNGEIQRIFLRAGARYYVYKNLNAGVSIKAHKGKADFIEWTVGYTLNR